MVVCKGGWVPEGGWRIGHFRAVVEQLKPCWSTIQRRGEGEAAEAIQAAVQIDSGDEAAAAGSRLYEDGWSEDLLEQRQLAIV